MKSSIYNIIVPLENAKSVIYNTRTGCIQIISDGALEILNDPNGESACNDLLDTDLTAFYEAGFLVDDSFNELEAVKETYKAAQNDMSTLSLCIAPTYACNLACPYCYEAGHDSPNIGMSAEIQKSILDFVDKAYRETPFEHLEVQWYGGEPMLYPDVVKDLSANLIDYCKERGIEYSAYMLSNCTLIGKQEAQMLKDAQIESIIVTIDGPESLHNKRRPCRDGSNSFTSILNAIEALLEQGIVVSAMMNTDNYNDELLDELNEILKNRFNIEAKRVLLNDYYQSFGTGQFCKPDFSLMSHREFAKQQCRRFCENHHTDKDFYDLMRPADLFCRGQKERYYCIDAEGNVFGCDGHLGRHDHILFNICDVNDAIPKGLAPDYPLNDKSCLACNLLPICRGNCEWERKQCTDHPCHPLKETMNEYLCGWASAISDKNAINA